MKKINEKGIYNPIKIKKITLKSLLKKKEPEVKIMQIDLLTEKKCV